HQPIFNETGSQCILYNGEVFNHADVRPELEKAGHRYKTRSDTETLLHAYEEYGPESLQRFRGMFAYAIWDNQRRTLLLTRDRLGIKPLYYHWDGSTLVFGSEIKSLLEHPSVRAEFEPALLAEYLCFGYTSDDRTLFKNIRRLLPGHHLTFAVDQE